jgi:ribosomal protein L2
LITSSLLSRLQKSLTKKKLKQSTMHTKKSWSRETKSSRTTIKHLCKLDEEYKKQKLKLHEWEKKKIKKIVEETHNDPKGRTAQIASEFGFELVTYR